MHDPRHAERRAGQTRRRRRVLRRRVAGLDALGTRFASGSLLKNVETNLSHSARWSIPGSELASKRTSIAVFVAPVSQSSVKCTLELMARPCGSPAPDELLAARGRHVRGVQRPADGSMSISSTNEIGIVPPVDHD